MHLAGVHSDTNPIIADIDIGIAISTSVSVNLIEFISTIVIIIQHALAS